MYQVNDVLARLELRASMHQNSMNLLNDIHIYLIHEGDLITDSGLPVVQTILILENLMQISADFILAFKYSRLQVDNNTYESMDELHFLN